MSLNTTSSTASRCVLPPSLAPCAVCFLAPVALFFEKASKQARGFFFSFFLSHVLKRAAWVCHISALFTFRRATAGSLAAVAAFGTTSGWSCGPQRIHARPTPFDRFFLLTTHERELRARRAVATRPCSGDVPLFNTFAVLYRPNRCPDRRNKQHDDFQLICNC